MAELTSFWESQTIIADVKKGNRGDIIRVSRVTKGRQTYVDVRVWFVHSETEVLTPGKGIAVPVDVAEQVFGSGLLAANP